jgi:hypothetical protein
MVFTNTPRAKDRHWIFGAEAIYHWPSGPHPTAAVLCDRVTFEEKSGTLARAEAVYVEQALPEIVSMGYDAGRDTFTDVSTGESMGRDEARKQFDTILAGAKEQTTAYTERLGIRTVSRYGAAKSALEESLGRVVEGSDNRRPNLNPRFTAVPSVAVPTASRRTPKPSVRRRRTRRPRMSNGVSPPGRRLTPQAPAFPPEGKVTSSLPKVQRYAYAARLSLEAFFVL